MGIGGWWMRRVLRGAGRWGEDLQAEANITLVIRGFLVRRGLALTWFRGVMAGLVRLRSGLACGALICVSKAKVGGRNLVCQTSDGYDRNDGTFEET